jgi:hypothetical protein
MNANEDRVPFVKSRASVTLDAIRGVAALPAQSVGMNLRLATLRKIY